jgi:hypothetical protein
MALDKFEGACEVFKAILKNFPPYSDAMSNFGLSYLCRLLAPLA